MDKRRSRLAQIHIAKKALKLNDESYRVVLEGAAGISSAADIKSDRQFYDIMKAFRHLGYSPRRGKDRQIAKCYALWCSLHQCGAVKHGSFSAMKAWMKRQTGGQDILTSSQKSFLIEELKNWKTRVDV